MNKSINKQNKNISKHIYAIILFQQIYFLFILCIACPLLYIFYVLNSIYSLSEKLASFLNSYLFIFLIIYFQIIQKTKIDSKNQQLKKKTDCFNKSYSNYLLLFIFASALNSQKYKQKF
ncbi:transmembrane protein, putative (macronuclear) [Tetrahymena thermophila SB210]|uniref:Transmembrane protein, putative n=1 Tax=Tetrahymena thermophila (strain SB210) TaxID=312017 RepID=W7XL60_TETTS|nr:transmembrane protein, putative [Tetrahymena thermophila SB210]EWS75724.1 transmembrane protein, putative [Tetrahymena thermophila SB210]|eukprot:XP_012651747.1 transmembrane protein, putative [Tetrahymena thermophila SB210]